MFADMGRHLIRRDGYIELAPADAEDVGDYARDREYLLPHADWLKAAMRDLGRGGDTM